MKRLHLGVFFTILIFLFSLFVIPDCSFARGGFSGGRSFSSSRSSSWNKSSSPSRSSSWGKSSSNKSKSSNWGKSNSFLNKKSNWSWGKSDKKSTSLSASRKTATNNRSVNKKLYNNAKKNGKAYTNKSEALKDFKSKNASKYTTKFSSRPSTRPAYVSSSVLVGGSSYPVIFHGGMYGYYGLGNVWVPYNPWMHNATYMERQMYNNGYYVGSIPVNYGMWFAYTFIFVLIVFVLWRAIYARRRD